MDTAVVAKAPIISPALSIIVDFRLLGIRYIRPRRHLRSARARLHHIEDGTALFGDTPAAVHPLNEFLRKDIELLYARRHSLGALGPVSTARR